MTLYQSRIKILLLVDIILLLLCFGYLAIYETDYHMLENQCIVYMHHVVAMDTLKDDVPQFHASIDLIKCVNDTEYMFSVFLRDTYQSKEELERFLLGKYPLGSHVDCDTLEKVTITVHVSYYYFVLFIIFLKINFVIFKINEIEKIPSGKYKKIM